MPAEEITPLFSCGFVAMEQNIKPKCNDVNRVFEGIELHIQNIDRNMDVDTLREEFKVFGHILKINIIESENSIRKRRYAALSYLSPADAARAIACMNGSILIENILFVTLASEKTRRRRPSPTPFIQALNAMSLLNQGNVPKQQRRKLSVQECNKIKAINDMSSGIECGGSLIDFKKKITRSHSRH